MATGSPVGTSIQATRKYAGHYLAAFAYRFNRRFDLRGLVARLIVDVALSKPAKETVVRSKADAGFLIRRAQVVNLVLPSIRSEAAGLLIVLVASGGGIGDAESLRLQCKDPIRDWTYSP